MKPMKLKLSGFGPFAGETVIDFEKAGKDGIFLITGDTGSGKTMIFDGIVFALYGAPSGDTRDVSMIRSSYADPETPTFVELMFSHKGRTYTVRRNPEYMRPARKGDGMAKEPADATLQMPDGTTVHKIREVDRKIQSLLKMDREQFLRISMLAQGSFQKLLFADTSVRQEIFRSLFGTERCWKTEQKLKEESNRLLRETEKLREKVEKIRQRILENADNQESDDTSDPSEMQKVINSRIESRSFLMEKLRKEQQQTRSRMQELRNQRETGNEREQLLSGLASDRDRIAEMKSRLVGIKQKNAEAEASQSEAVQLEQKAEQISDMLSFYEEYQKLSDENEMISGKIQEWESQIGQAKETRKKIVSMIDKTASCLKELEKDHDDIRGLEKTVALYRNRQGSLEGLKNTLDQFLKARENSSAAKESCLRMLKYAQECMDRSNSVFHQFLAAQAGVLASGLKDNVPCPVCGSHSHPSPATAPKLSVSKDDVDRTREEADTAKEDASEASIHAAEFNKEKELLEKEYEKSFSELFPKTELHYDSRLIDGEIQKIEGRILSAVSRIEAEKKRIQNRVRAAAAFKNCKQKLSQLDTAVTQREDAIKAGSRKITGNEERMNSLSLLPEYDTEDKAREAMESFRREAESIRGNMAESDEEESSLEEEIRKAEAEAAVKEARISEMPQTDPEALETEFSGLKEKEEIQEKEILELYARIEKDRKLEKELSDMSVLSDESRLLMEKSSWMKLLADTACGKLSGKDKVTFETYVQRAYFDRVLSSADSHMSAMSSGRYGLVRASGSSDNRSKSGLDINVADHWNQTERSARSLSGGESFLASLSLALGLSEILQSDIGDIAVESMFVDEGFGSLDDESLEAACKVLESLPGTGCMIGVISHVGALKDRITNQIEVSRPGSGGSRAVIIS